MSGTIQEQIRQAVDRVVDQNVDLRPWLDLQNPQLKEVWLEAIKDGEQYGGTRQQLEHDLRIGASSPRVMAEGPRSVRMLLIELVRLRQKESTGAAS